MGDFEIPKPKTLNHPLTQTSQLRSSDTTYRDLKRFKTLILQALPEPYMPRRLGPLPVISFNSLNPEPIL